MSIAQGEGTWEVMPRDAIVTRDDKQTLEPMRAQFQEETR